MKYKALSLLLATILAMGITTLFTACPEPKPEQTRKVTPKAKAGTGTAPSITAKAGDKLGEAKLTLILPSTMNYGLRHNSTPVIKADARFWLYYLKSDDNKTVEQITTAVTNTAVRNKASDTDKGVINLTVSADNKPFYMIDGLTAGAQYNFFVRIIHPDSTIADPSKPKANEGAEYARDTAVVRGTSKGAAARTGTAPGKASSISTDNTMALELKFMVDAPVSLGTKKNGVDVLLTELTYRLYYALVGETFNSVTISDTTTAAEVITAVGTVTDATDKTKGRIDATVADIATRFKLSGLTAGDTYRYTVVVVHPDGTTTSASTTAKTSEAVRATDNQATEPPVPILNEPSDKTHTGFTIEWTLGAIDAGTHKNDDGEALTSAEVSYNLYYASSSTALSASQIKAVAEQAQNNADDDTGGVETVAADDSKTVSPSGKAFVHTLYIVVEAINTDNPNKTTASNVKNYGITGAKVAPTVPQPADITVTPRKDTLTVQVTPLTTGNFGTSDNGTPLDADTVRYIFYYAKKNVDIAGKKAEAATADELYAALKSLAGSTNNADKGKVALTTAKGVGTDEFVPNLSLGMDYYYTVRIEETAAPSNGVNTAKMKTTPSAATKGTGTNLSITTGKGDTPGEVKITLILPKDMNYGLRHDGTTPLTMADVTFWLYYLKSDDDTTVKQIATAVADTAVHKRASNKATRSEDGSIVCSVPCWDKDMNRYKASDTDKGVIRLTVFEDTQQPFYTHKRFYNADNKPFYIIKDLAADAQYSFFVRIVHPDSTIANKNVPRANEGAEFARDTAVVRGTSEAKKQVIGLASKGTGTAPSINAGKGNNPGEVQLTLTNPENWGTRDDGSTPVAKGDVTFWLFYQEGLKDKDTIIKGVGDKAVHTTDLEAPNNTKGVIQIASNATQPFVLTGLKKDTQYSFFLRIIHPDAPAGTKANERTEYARDTDVVLGTSASKGWYVSSYPATKGTGRPQGIAVADNGNTVYVVDTHNHRIKKLTLKNGSLTSISIIAGKDITGYKDDTRGTNARFRYPSGIAVASDGSVLYVSDTDNDRIRKITLVAPYKVSTIASGFKKPTGIAVAPDGTLYVADTGNNRINTITKDGTVTTIAGKAWAYGNVDNSTGTSAKFNGPHGIAIDTTGSVLYVADRDNNSIRKIDLTSPYKVSTIASGFDHPQEIAVSPKGTLYVADTDNHRIRKITLNKDGSFEPPSIIAGKVIAGDADGIGKAAGFSYPKGIAAVSDTILYVADTHNNIIRKLEYKE